MTYPVSNAAVGYLRSHLSVCCVLVNIVILLADCGLVAFAADEKPSQAQTRATENNPPPVAKSIHPALMQVEEDPALPRVLLIGDSISMGYTLPLREKFKQTANVQHPTENCGASRRILERIDQYLGDKDWDVIQFNSGIHDLTLMSRQGATSKSDEGGTVQVPLDEYRTNLEKIIKRLKQTGATLIWCTTTPISESARFRRPADVARYNRVAQEVMKAHGVQITDLHQHVLKDGSPPLSPDGVHFTPAGYEEMADFIAPTIERSLAAKPK